MSIPIKLKINNLKVKNTGTANIICADSLVWMDSLQPESLDNVVTGIPDMDELGISNPSEYISFFRRAARLVFSRVKSDGYAIFIQTDRKCNGEWIDKSYLLTDEAIKMGQRLIWHKIVCQRHPGKINLHRPTYSHMVCYSRKGRPGKAMTDVVPDSTVPEAIDVLPVGSKAYSNATPENGARFAIEYLAQQFKDPSNMTVVDPFVGRGTILIIGMKSGFKVLGIDIDESQCEITRRLLSII